MNENLLTATILIVTFSLIFREKLKKLLELSKEKTKKPGWTSLYYLVLALFGLFVMVSFPPPWSFPPLVTTLYSIFCMKYIRKKQLFHIVSSAISIAIGVALSNNAVVIRYEKNELFLFGHYLNITYEIGPTLLLSALPVMFSSTWSMISTLVAEKSTQHALKP